MLNDSERQAIQEVLEACRTHNEAIMAEIRDRALLGHDLSRLMDVQQGLAISISKLETVLNAGKAETKAVMKLIRRMGVNETALDDMVHDVASAIGSNVNNGGIESQVEFLVSQGVTSDEILRQIKEVM